MRIHEVNGQTEKLVLAALVFNDAVLAQSLNKIDEQAFSSKLAASLAERCAQHYKKYKKAPGLALKDWIESKVSRTKDKDEAHGLEAVWNSFQENKSTVSGKKANVQYLTDQANSLFHQNRLKLALDAARDAFEDNNYKAAGEILNTFRDSSATSSTQYVDPFVDLNLVTRAYTGKEKPLICMQGAVGRFFGHQLDRENFVAFQGPDKSFKSFWLQEMQYQALKQRLRVMFVGIGDMSQDQYIKRFCSRILRRPEHKQKYTIPVGWNKSRFQPRRIVLPKMQKRFAKKGITAVEAKQAMAQFTQRYLRTKERGKFFKMLVDFAVSVEEIEAKIVEFQNYDNWVPDVLIVDYADRLDPPKHVRDKLEQVDYNWKHLRRIALDYHCLVLTATQVRRSGYRGRLQSRDDAADNKNKNAHVTGMVGINATMDEYEKNARTLNWIVLREYTSRSTVHTAGCPAIANPCVLSC